MVRCRVWRGRTVRGCAGDGRGRGGPRRPVGSRAPHRRGVQPAAGAPAAGAGAHRPGQQPGGPPSRQAGGRGGLPGRPARRDTGRAGRGEGDAGSGRAGGGAEPGASLPAGSRPRPAAPGAGRRAGRRGRQRSAPPGSADGPALAGGGLVPGRRPARGAAAGRAARRAGRGGAPGGRVRSARDRGDAGHPGRLEAAEQLAQECFERGAKAGDVDADAWYGAQLVAIRWYQGRLPNCCRCSPRWSTHPR